MLKPWWRVRCEAARAIFQYGDTVLVCEGPSVPEWLPRLAPLLDGHHSTAAIVDALGANAAAFVGSIIEAFTARGLLVDGAPLGGDIAPPTREMVHFVAATQPTDRTLNDDARRLTGLRVGIVGASSAAGETGRAVTAVGGRTVGLAWNAAASERPACDIIVVAPSGAELPELTGWNRRALDLRCPWLAVLPFDGTFAAVGPIYVPGRTACYECFRARRAANVRYTDQWWSLQESPAPYPAPVPVDLLLASLASLTLVRSRLRPERAVAGAYLAVEIDTTIRVTDHVVHRVPRCAACAAVDDDLAHSRPRFAEAVWTD